MADNLNGDIEVYTGPRGFSVTGATGDGVSVRFTTDEPRTLNPVPLPRGRTGAKGEKGNPGQASIRVDETVGYRVFLWEVATPGEQLVYGDTGFRTLAGGVLRRTGNTVETTVTDLASLPAGFKPGRTGTTGPVFTTTDNWPASLPGTKLTDPVKLRGLEGYDAATANGYPGTPDQWLEDRYRVLQDPAGAKLGQVYTRTETGAAWADLPRIGPGPWKNITLDTDNWRVTSHLGNRAQTRTNNGRVDFYGHITRTGPTVQAGMWSTDGVRIGVLAPEDAPAFNIELVCITYEGESGAGRPVPARLHVSDQGVMQLMAFSDDGRADSLTIKAGVTQVGITGLSYPARNQ